LIRGFGFRHSGFDSQWTALSAHDTIPHSVRYAYPLMLDVSERLVVIIGGGAVAARKARGLIKAGAKRIRVVSPVFDPGVPAAVARVTETYEPRHLDGGGLVFAATDRPEVNESVVRDARARGILAARADADEGESGDFSTPAHFREGQVIVSVSAGSAALTAAIRDGLAERFDPRWSVMADCMRTLRPLILKTLADNPARRTKVLRALAGDEAMAAAEQGAGGVMAWLGERFPEFKHA
jgi:precorrin-2 dehydrogenase/sirohydrochlorin ferrochelatase